MGTSFRVVAIIGEVAILMAMVYSLFSGVLLAAVDLGVDPKYRRYLGLVMTVIGGLGLIFFFGHLIAFYPRIVP